MTEGRLDFGTWEQIFYGEFDGRRRKRVLVKIIREYDAPEPLRGASLALGFHMVSASGHRNLLNSLGDGPGTWAIPWSNREPRRPALPRFRWVGAAAGASGAPVEPRVCSLPFAMDPHSCQASCLSGNDRLVLPAAQNIPKEIDLPKLSALKGNLNPVEPRII